MNTEMRILKDNKEVQVIVNVLGVISDSNKENYGNKKEKI
jgi:hypothetical protein